MLKSLEIAKDISALRKNINSIKAQNKVVPIDMVDQLDNLLNEYNLQVEKENQRKKGGQSKMPMTLKERKAAFNRVIKCLLTGSNVVDADKPFLPLAVNTDTGVITGQAGSTGADGGYLVPQEYLNLDEYGQDIVSLKTIAGYIPVTSPTGLIPNFDYTQVKDGKFLVEVAELATIEEGKVNFDQLDYACKDLMRCVPVSRQLLADQQLGDVMAVLGHCFGVAEIAHANKIILAEAAKAKHAPAAVSFATDAVIKAIITAIRGTLTGANRSNATIVCCDSDFAKLATLQDKQGRFYLKQSVKDPAVYEIEGVPVVAVDDVFMTKYKAGEDGKLTDEVESIGGTIYVGNFNRIKLFVREGLEIEADRSAGFSKHAVMVKGIVRECAKNLEPGAFVKPTATA